MLTLVSTIFVLGVLIFVHELGHFMAAKAVGIAVPRFSLGLGPPTPLAFRRGETEYVISWVPFGGYVKMASLEEQEAMAALEGGGLEQEFPRDRLFESKSLPARMLVLLAGVMMNALFAWVTYSGLLLARGQAVELTTAISRVDAATLPEAASALAEIPFGTRVERINGQAITSWNDVMDGVLEPRSDELVFELSAGGPIVVGVPGVDADRRVLIAQALRPLREPRVGAMLPDRPAAAAGIESGDLITHIGGAPIASWDDLVDVIQPSAGQPLLLSIDRGGEAIEFEVTPAENEVEDPVTGEMRKVGQIGINPMLKTRKIELGFTASLAEGARQTWDNGVRILVFLKGLVMGQVSLTQLGGPIMIGQASGQFARAGFLPLLSFMAFLSINLAILNLLPIPLLDGGTLVFLIYEGVRGKPLPLNLRMGLMNVGMFLLVCIMLFAVVNDIFRIIN